MVRIDKLGKVITGNTPSKNKKEYYNEAITPFIKPNNFNAVSISSLSESDEYLSHAGAKVGRLVEEGAVLVTCIGTIGSVGIANKEICFNQQINAVVPNEGIVNNRYLAYAIIKRREQLKALANAPVVPIINKTQFSAFEIPLPPLETQKKIVEVLDKSQGLIDARKEQISLIDELIQSVFYEMFGDPVTNSKVWEVCKMASLGSFKNGINFSSSDSGVTLNCLGVGDFKSLYKINQTEVLPRVSLNQIPSEGYMLKNKDIVFVRSNGNKALVGRSVIVYPNDNKTTFSGFCIRLRVESTVVHEEFLIHLLRSNSVKQKLLSDGRGANISNLNQKMLSDIDIVLPPKELQMKFYKIVEKIEIQKSNMELSLAEHTMSFQSLMKKFFQY